MSRWFRLYDEMLDDPKLQRLPAETFKAVVNLWCIASRNGGKLPPCSDIAFSLRVTESNAVTLLDELVTLGFLDHDDDGLRPHNWDKRQYKSDTVDGTNAERQKRFRERHRNGVTPVTVTPTRDRTEAETEQKEKKDRPKREARLRTSYPEDFENGFWKPYPTSPNMSKSEALTAWKGLSEEERKLASAAVPAFKNWLRGQKDHPVVHACRFLKQRRFEGFAAQGPPANNGLADELAIIRRQIAEAANGKADSAGGGRVGADNDEELRPARAIAR
jgi:hypothetical protein